MYATYFGLSKEPFSIAPDPRFLFMSERHREALAHLLYGLGGGGGFVLLTGEIGAGKTTVCRCFLEQVPEHCTVAYVFNPKLTAIELLQTVCHEFGIAAPADSSSLKAHVDALNAFLLGLHAQGRQAVLVIDEAQALSADVLEQLRLLTNLETTERKLLQIVLIGQPELRTMLARPELEQLAQRVIARYHLGPLSERETQQYIRHRLAVAGPNAPLPFDNAALARIQVLSGGIPRRINLLADRALLGAYAQGLLQADRHTVDQAASEVLTGDEAPPPRPWGRIAATAALVALVGAGAWTVGRMQRDDAPAPLAAASQPLPGAASAPAIAAAQATTTAAAEAPAGSDPASLLAAAHPDADTAWRELALRWNVAIGEGDPCVAAQQAQLACYVSPLPAGLPVVRQIGRPGLLTLRGADGKPRYAVLVGLSASQATVQAAGRSFSLSLPALAGIWRGEFATFWRTPPGWRDGDRSSWAERQLPAAAGQSLADRVQAFQLAQGLSPDGLIGPLTVMRLNRVGGVDEPRLPGLP